MDNVQHAIEVIVVIVFLVLMVLGIDALTPGIDFVGISTAIFG